MSRDIRTMSREEISQLTSHKMKQGEDFPKDESGKYLPIAFGDPLRDLRTGEYIRDAEGNLISPDQFIQSLV